MITTGCSIPLDNDRLYFTVVVNPGLIIGDVLVVVVRTFSVLNIYLVLGIPEAINIEYP